MEDSETNRRRSGRAIRKPYLFAEEEHAGSILSNGSSKRKHDDVDCEDGFHGRTRSESEEESSGDEETQDKRRNVRHGSKRAKPNGATALAIRPANVPSKPRTKSAKAQKARARPSQMHLEGLYAEVFGRGSDGAEVAAMWHRQLEQNNVLAVCDLVNFILRCIGCDFSVETHDIEDLDNVPIKVGDILDEFQVIKDAEYPLISRSKQYTAFREVLEEFSKALIEALHTSNVFYEDQAVFDNVQTWVGTLSAASLRPFRHTATVISLSMSSALCDVAASLLESVATSRKQMDVEKRKKSINKGRIKTIEETIVANERKVAQIDALLKDSFDTVFVHRYRDVDEKIRVECANALGYWISTYRKMFLEGTYLRYLGWVLSDTNTQTRLEVVRQLRMLFREKRNIAALRAFTERFRPRLVEMGARDADITVRVETIELLDRLRNAELLEPDDIDTVGRLIFDIEPRIRKAVSKFLVANIEDLYGASIEDIDAELYNEALPKSTEDRAVPTQGWIRFKCLAQILKSYDLDDESSVQQRWPELGLYSPDSRYMLATQAIFPHFPELRSWESMAGYLLYDHSTISTADGDAEVAVANCYKLEAGEDVVLLDVLYMIVKISLQEIVDSRSDHKKGKKSNKAKDEVQELLGDASHSLTVIIPRLLNKYGSTPSAATSILRLEQLLNIDLVDELAQADGMAATLIDDVNKQFVGHSDRKVLTEASRALRQARTYQQSKDLADAKVQETWEDSIATLQNLLKGKNIDTRGSVSEKVLAEVVDTVVRISHLTGIADCTAIIQRRLPPAANAKRSKNVPEMTLFEALTQLVRRGVPDETTEIHIDELEDELCVAAMATVSVYFRWKLVALKSAVEKNHQQSSDLSSTNLTNLVMHRQSFVEALNSVISSRSAIDHIRSTAITTALDLFVLFATTRNLSSTKTSSGDELRANQKTLVLETPSELIKEALASHAALERAFAKRTRRKIEIVAKEREVNVDDAPVDSDDDQADDDDEDAAADDGLEEEFGTSKHAKKAATLLAEQSLCELTSKIVLCLVAGIVGMADGELVRARLMLNRTKLGKSYAQVVAYLDEKKIAKKIAAAKGAGTGPQGGLIEKAVSKGMEKETESDPLVLEDDDIEDNDDDEDGDEDEEELLRKRNSADHDDHDNEEADEEEQEGDGAVHEEIMGD